MWSGRKLGKFEVFGIRLSCLAFVLVGWLEFGQQFSVAQAIVLGVNATVYLAYVCLTMPKNLRFLDNGSGHKWSGGLSSGYWLTIILG